MSPLELGICLHYHSRVGDDPWIGSGSPIVDQTMAGLVSDGLLTKVLNGGLNGLCHFQPTDKLHMFVAMLKATPLPQQRWVDPRTSKVV